MPRPTSHLFEVTIDLEFAQPAVPAHVDLQIPKWQPGRYAIADFAKNVQEFSAGTGSRQLAVSRIDDQTWRVETQQSRTITVAYKVYGNDLSGTFAQLDADHANYNGGEVFMYVVGHKHEPVNLHIDAPRGWRVINGRSESPNQVDWTFPNYEILIDNPTEIGPAWTLDAFQLGGRTYRVMVHSRGDEGGRRPALVRDIERIVRAQTAMWGEPDLDRFTFMIHFAADNRSSDGMEHLTSTQIINPGVLANPSSYAGVLDSASHEFFHVWNVKRLRPVELGPWDWTRPVHTPNLWIAEGVTNYYGNIMLRRAGLQDANETLARLQQTIAFVENQPGSRVMSAESASLAAPFTDGTLHRQRTNLANTSISYYTKGELVAFVLDLMIRGRTRGQKSLDDVMLQMYEEFYVRAPNATYYLKGRGYTRDDFARTVSQVAGADMSEFFRRHVSGVETLPYDEALAYAGLRLARVPAPRTAGIVLDPSDVSNARLGAIRGNSAADLAGLQEGDILESIGNRPVLRANWRALLNTYREGDRVAVRVRRFTESLELTLVLGPPDILDYIIEEFPAPTPAARAIRSAWLGE
jgi:predicted metalloprotease with PDZ domain